MEMGSRGAAGFAHPADDVALLNRVADFHRDAIQMHENRLHAQSVVDDQRISHQIHVPCREPDDAVCGATNQCVHGDGKVEAVMGAAGFTVQYPLAAEHARDGSFDGGDKSFFQKERYKICHGHAQGSNLSIIVSDPLYIFRRGIDISVGQTVDALDRPGICQHSDDLGRFLSAGLRPDQNILFPETRNAEDKITPGAYRVWFAVDINRGRRFDLAQDHIALIGCVR